MANKKREPDYFPMDFHFGGKLPLPLFGDGVAKSSPRTVAVPADTFLFDAHFQSGDAFSVSYLHEGDAISSADQGFLPLDIGYLRRILLEVFSREEYEDIDGYHQSLESWEPTPGAEHDSLWGWNFRIVKDPDATAQVRLSDLRLATEIDTTSTGARGKIVRNQLLRILEGLTQPITTGQILRWKWELLKKHNAFILEARKGLSEWTKENKEHERLVLVSFTAAALCLLLSLGKSDLEEASTDALVDSVLELHDIVRKFANTLDTRTEQLRKLVAPRRPQGGRPPEPIKRYVALHCYRMGHGWDYIARRIGIEPSKSEVSEGSHDSQAMVKSHVIEGIEVEKEWLREAAEIFARKDDPDVQSRALKAYAKWEYESYVFGAGYSGTQEESDMLASAFPATPQAKVYLAYVQLGSCLRHNLDPLPSAERL